ncbi:unnamed protein product [Periconia digitata]|uniref:Uncharacterized protein n=1 Tax=Periconia digitata TaxID=1303443 RepID=A0A9W4UA95_9PLEO|nr:unnamed protein product [Periconia digitata]
MQCPSSLATYLLSSSSTRSFSSHPPSSPKTDLAQHLPSFHGSSHLTPKRLPPPFHFSLLFCTYVCKPVHVHRFCDPTLSNPMFLAQAQCVTTSDPSPLPPSPRALASMISLVASHAFVSRYTQQ